MLSDGGGYWDTTISHLGNGPTTVDILEENGRASRFTGSSTDAQHWLDRKRHELENAYGIPTKVAVGTVLVPMGLALVLLGLALLLWRLATVCRSRGHRFADRTARPNLISEVKVLRSPSDSPS